MAAEFHDALAAWSTAVGAAVVSVSAILAVVQLVELKRSRQADGVFRVLDLLSGGEMALRRAELLRAAPRLPPVQSLDDETFAAAWLEWRPVSITFDQVGLLAQSKMVPTWVVLDMYRDTIVNTWDVLAPYIRRERERRPFPQYQYHFEWLYGEACNYRRKPYSEAPKHPYRTG